MQYTYFPSHTVIHRGVEILSWLPDIMAYFPRSCPAPIYSVYLKFGHSLDLSHNVLHDWLFPYHWSYTYMYMHVCLSRFYPELRERRVAMSKTWPHQQLYSYDRIKWNYIYIVRQGKEGGAPHFASLWLKPCICLSNNINLGQQFDIRHERVLSEFILVSSPQ